MSTVITKMAVHGQETTSEAAAVAEQTISSMRTVRKTIIILVFFTSNSDNYQRVCLLYSGCIFYWRRTGSKKV